jgi:type II secretory pathway pseudopilin PulG
MDCPLCAEAVEDDAERCVSCGEVLQAEASPVATGGAKTALVVLGGICLLCLVGGGVLLALLMPAMQRAGRHADKTRCMSNLRQLGLASIQYADDKRFFPHVGPITDLDGDVTTNDGPRKIRTLLFYGYHDYPEGWICPSSSDQGAPLAPGIRGNMRTWFWSGGVTPGPGGSSPIGDALQDPAHDQTTELSYGFSRRGINVNARSTVLFGADRARRDGTGAGTALVGNHQTGWNVLRVDCTVEWEPAAGTPAFGRRLTGTGPFEGPSPPGALAIKPGQ